MSYQPKNQGEILMIISFDSNLHLRFVYLIFEKLGKIQNKKVKNPPAESFEGLRAWGNRK